MFSYFSYECILRNEWILPDLSAVLDFVRVIVVVEIEDFMLYFASWAALLYYLVLE